jgi:imidazolonepropionase-like amidohydrolase
VNLRGITGSLLYDGSTDPPRPETTIIWQGPRIIWVGPDADADLEDTKVLSDGGAVVPGLIDCHVHLCLDATIEGIEEVAKETIEQLLSRSIGAARILLGAGITAARDQGSTQGVAIQVAQAQRRGDIEGARILASGRGITATGGHGWMIGVEADGPDAVRAAVAQEIERGAQIIKLFPTGGVLGSGAHGFDTVMSAEEVSAAVDEAHSRELLVGAHVHGPEGIDMVLDAGVDTIEHATGITKAQAKRCIELGVALVPTLAATDVMLDHQTDLPADLLNRVVEVRRLQTESIRTAIAAGALVLTGTDAGTPFNPPGQLVREMELLADLGLGTRGAIAAATSLAAKTLRLDGLGSIEAGQIADLLVVAEDPGADLSVLRNPLLIVQGGEVVG